MSKISSSFVLLLLLASTTCADVRVPRLFADNMILQQESNNAIWGWATPGETIKVVASWKATTSTKADSRGRWRLFLETPAHGTGHSLSITGLNTIHIKNVAIGEVWLCAGQSNTQAASAL